jgi:hypothetical protein
VKPLRRALHLDFPNTEGCNVQALITVDYSVFGFETQPPDLTDQTRRLLLPCEVGGIHVICRDREGSIATVKEEYGPVVE